MSVPGGPDPDSSPSSSSFSTRSSSSSSSSSSSCSYSATASASAPASSSASASASVSDLPRFCVRCDGDGFTGHLVECLTQSELWTPELVQNWVKSNPTFNTQARHFRFTSGRNLLRYNAERLRQIGVAAGATVPLEEWIQKLRFYAREIDEIDHFSSSSSSSSTLRTTYEVHLYTPTGREYPLVRGTDGESYCLAVPNGEFVVQILRPHHSCLPYKYERVQLYVDGTLLKYSHRFNSRGTSRRMFYSYSSNTDDPKNHQYRCFLFQSLRRSGMSSENQSTKSSAASSSASHFGRLSVHFVRGREARRQYLPAKVFVPRSDSSLSLMGDQKKFWKSPSQCTFVTAAAPISKASLNLIFLTNSKVSIPGEQSDEEEREGFNSDSDYETEKKQQKPKLQSEDDDGDGDDDDDDGGDDDDDSDGGDGDGLLSRKQKSESKRLRCPKLNSFPRWIHALYDQADHLVMRGLLNPRDPIHQKFIPEYDISADQRVKEKRTSTSTLKADRKKWTCDFTEDERKGKWNGEEMERNDDVRVE